MALRVPLLASLAVPIYAPTTALWALVCGTFPQYIINVSHALETRDLGTATLVSLSGSLLMLVLAPIHMMAKDDSDGAQQQGRGSWRELGGVYLSWVGRRLLVLLPVILIEVIHFMPVLIERYYYGGLTRSGYIGYLVAFNAPKLLFLLQRRKGYGDKLEQLYISLFFSLAIMLPCAVLLWDHGNVHDSRGAGLLSGVVIGFLLLLFVLRVSGLLKPDELFISTHRGWLPVLVVMPLVPCAAIIEADRKKHADGLATFHTHLLVIYMLLSYGSLGFLLGNHPGKWTGVTLAVCYVLLVVIALTWLRYHAAITAFTTAGSSIVDKLDSGSGGTGWQHRLKAALNDESQRELDLRGCGMGALDAQELARQLPSCRCVLFFVILFTLLHCCMLCCCVVLCFFLVPIFTHHFSHSGSTGR